MYLNKIGRDGSMGSPDRPQTTASTASTAETAATNCAHMQNAKPKQAHTIWVWWVWVGSDLLGSSRSSVGTGCPPEQANWGKFTMPRTGTPEAVIPHILHIAISKLYHLPASEASVTAVRQFVLPHQRPYHPSKCSTNI